MKKYAKIIYDGVTNAANAGVYAFVNYGPVKLYQPVYGKKKEASASIRDSQDRWDAIEPVLGKGQGSVLDIGCNLGFFSFKAAESGRSVIGIDHDSFNILYCKAIQSANKVDRTIFVDKNLDLEAMKNLPRFDVIFNFSVFHHWVKAYGEETAKDMMRVLASKCDALYFETGQPDEVGTKWAPKMAFMGSDPKAWIENFLREIGFSNVSVIGTFSTGLTNTPRYLFAAKK